MPTRFIHVALTTIRRNPIAFTLSALLSVCIYLIFLFQSRAETTQPENENGFRFVQASANRFHNLSDTVITTAAADHHMHIQGPAISAELVLLKKKLPDVFKNFDEAFYKERHGSDAIRQLDEAGIKQGVLMSEAYMFTSPMVADEKLDFKKLTREENQFNVDAAANSGGRLKAFVGINPVAPNAIEELTYWGKAGTADGIKMHLANSRFDPKKEEDVRKLTEVFDLAKKYKMPIMIHVRNAKEYSLDDVKIFIEKVLPHAGSLPIQIAHAGGWGGLDQVTLDALATYAPALKNNAPGTKNLKFDLALIVVDKNTDKQLAQSLATTMRSIGLDRFVMASDWPARMGSKEFYELIQNQVPLTAKEWKIVMSNKAGYLK